MSFVRSNIDAFAKEVRDYTADEVAEMTTEQFDKLPLSDQISIYHNHRAEYDRLTGHTSPDAVGNRNVTEKAIDEYERLVDGAISRAFHPNGA